MADSVVKLKVNSQEYDQKIQRAAQGLRAFIEDCRKSGQSLTEVSGETMQFVQNLGKMPTVADNGVKSIREYTKSITDLTIQFRSLSDEEKKSPFGQALAAGIQQLTERAGMVKDAMNDVSASIQNAASDTRTFDQLAGAANLAVSGFQTLQGTLNLLGVEMGDDVAVIAKLQAAMAVTNGLTQIQATLQKQSALMQGVLNVQKMAGAKAEALLAANTGKATVAQRAFNAVATANPYGLLLTAIGSVVSALSLFSSSTNDASDDLDDLSQHADMASDAIAKISDSVDFDVKIAEAVGRSKKAILELRIAAAQAKVDTAKAAAEEYNRTVEAYTMQQLGDIGNPLRVAGRKLGIIGGVEKPKQETKEKIEQMVKDAVEEQKQLQREMVGANLTRFQIKANAVDPTTIKTQREFEATVNGIKDMLRDAGKPGDKQYDYLKGLQTSLEQYGKDQGWNTTKILVGGGRGGRTGGRNTTKPEKAEEVIPEGSVKDYTKQISELQKAQELATNTTQWRALQTEIDVLTNKIKMLKGEFQGGLTPEQTFQDSLSAMGTLPENFATDHFEKMAKLNEQYAKDMADQQAAAAQKTAQSWQIATQSINQVGSALQGLEDPSVKIAGLIGQAIANIALGFAQAAAKDSKLGVFGWIAAVAGGLATMIGTISAIHSATGYAQGGIVKGNSYSGDNIGGLVDGSQLVGLNAGELVLTRAMQGNLAQQLEGNGLGNLTLTSKIRGENIIMSINSTSRRRGKGEMVTSKFKR